MQSSSSAKLLEYNHFIDSLNKKVSSDSTEVYTALLFIEFDNLAWFNDIFDSNIDNQIMLKIIEKLINLLGRDDLLVRKNKYQYIIMHDYLEFEDPIDLANNIMHHILSEPFTIDSNMFYIHGSIGISRSPFDGRNANKLMRIAERMMKIAQRDGTNNIVSSKGLDTQISCDKSKYVIEELPAALENGDIYFLYQPQYSHKEKRFTGAEMLARWKHEKYGYISPELFIPLAEKSGMIGPLTVRAIITASETFTLLQKYGIKNFSLSVNISPIHLMTSSFFETVKFLVEHYPLHGEKLNFEITEEVVLKNTDILIQKLEQLKTLNINIELDDFGTGHTSLQHLANLPIDTIKVDRTFIQNINNDVKKQALFTAIVNMSRALNIEVVAEGVEETSEDDVIKAFDTVTVQGYLYSKPMELMALVEKFNTIKV